MAENLLLWASRKANQLFKGLCLHRSCVWHRVNHRGFCFPADINNDTYNFLLAQGSHKSLSIREMSNYLLNPARCSDWVKYWLPRFKGSLCHQMWTWASYFLGTVQIKWIGDKMLCAGRRGTKKGTTVRAGCLRNKHLSLEPVDLECGCYWWFEGEFYYKKKVN